MVVAKRYAEGLLKLGIEENKLEILMRDLLKVYELFKNNQEFVEILFDEKIKRFDKKKKIKTLLKNIQVDMYIENLIYLLVDRGREAILPYIPLYYKEIYDKMVGNVDVEIIAYEPFEEHLIDKIRAWLGKRYGIKNPIFQITIDKSIVGGIKLIFNNIEVDATIKGALDNMKQELIQKVV